MILKNGNIFYDNKFQKADVVIQGDIISDIDFNCSYKSGMDFSDKYIFSGLVDIHTHGCIGSDFSYATQEEIHKMRKYYLKNGITSILATTVSLPDEDIVSAVNSIKSASDKHETEANIEGINLEGPYLSPKKCGAHDIKLLKEPDIDFVLSLGNFIKIVNIAPEYENTLDFIRKFKGKVSIAHTNCDYKTAKDAIDAGADHITHLFNAMNQFHHRNPGVIGAFFDTDSVGEIICDAVHIHESVLRMMFNAKPDKLAIISDSMSATGLSDGKYKLGKLDVTVSNSIATLNDGTLAGSSMNLYSMMKKLIDVGVKPEKAIASATSIPADSVNMGNKIGRIEVNRSADIVIANKDFSINKVIHNGLFIDKML